MIVFENEYHKCNNLINTLFFLHFIQIKNIQSILNFFLNKGLREKLNIICVVHIFVRTARTFGILCQITRQDHFEKEKTGPLKCLDRNKLVQFQSYRTRMDARKTKNRK